MSSVGTLFATMFLLAACGDDDGSSGSESAEAGPCSEVQEVEVPQEKEFHKNGTFSAADYETNPPAGGAHSLDFLDGPSINPPVKDLGAAVHSLDHGAVILWPSNQLNREDENELLSTYRDLAAKDPTKPGDRYTQLIIVGNPDQDAPFAMTAWGYLQECESVDPEAIRAFVEEYFASGPEGQEVACAGTIYPAPKVPACEKS